MVVRQGMRLAAIGAVVGLVAAGFGARLLRGFVPGPEESWWAGAGAAGLVLAASAAACAVPAVKALRLDPAKVLRED
jgi:ABC-type antimicrobial peptide transport system permease subunit